MKIAVTGGYGSGKSSVTRMLSGYLNGVLIDTDQICRELLEPDEPGFFGLIDSFGTRFLGKDGIVDRQSLRDATFSSDTVKKELEAILHPLVRERVSTLGEIGVEKNQFYLVEVPLLYEVGWQDDFDITILVRVDEATSVRRTVKRDGIDRAEAIRIIGLQMPMTCKEPLADYIIDNSSTFVSTAQQTGWLSNFLGKKQYIK